MATLLGTLFSTGENTVAQADVQLLGKTVESLIIENSTKKNLRNLFFLRLL